MTTARTTVTLKKWGNSIGLLLPGTVARAVHLASGTQVEIDVSEETLVIRKAVRKAPAPLRIETLCAGITAKNLHSETEWGSPQGNEAW